MTNETNNPKTQEELNLEIKTVTRKMEGAKIELCSMLVLNHNLLIDTQIEYYARFKCLCIGSRRAKNHKLFRSEEYEGFQWDISRLSNNDVDELMQASLAKDINLLEYRTYAIASRQEIKDFSGLKYKKEVASALCEKYMKNKETLMQLEDSLRRI